MMEIEVKAGTAVQTADKDVDSTHQEAKDRLLGYLNKRMRVFLSDGRVIIGNFLCTDRDSNLVLGSCEEYLSQDDLADVKGQTTTDHVPRQPRTIGLAIVPGHHIRNLSIAKTFSTQTFHIEPTTTSASASPETSIDKSSSSSNNSSEQFDSVDT